MADQRVIDAHPTKAFFIEMLIKDIGLTRAIIDLVDNSVDGARRIRPNGDFADLAVRLEATPEYFKISDNCGGMTVEMATTYAFRFGRPEGMPLVSHSVGQFGVGMKRALFKLGKEFRVQSAAETSRFVVRVDVDDWKTTDVWEFEFEALEEGLPVIPDDQRGTSISVTTLHPSVAEDFGLANFQSRLTEEIKDAHLDSMQKGLVITHNGVPLDVEPLKLIHSEQLKPGFREITIEQNGKPPVTVKLYAGIAESEPSDAGWYIFCNGRLVLGPDQSIVTGWGEGRETTIPKYHNQYARFRGYAFLDSDDAGLLPWNTTKTGVDLDSPIYRAVRLEMIKLAKPVITFLNRLKTEGDREESDNRPLQSAVDTADRATLDQVATDETFVAPTPPPPPPLPRSGRIQYSKPVDEINRVKKVLRVSTMREVGEETFDYFYARECED